MKDPNLRCVARLTLKLIAMAPMIGIAPWPATAGVIYVRADASGAGNGTGEGGDGTSWADAFVELQSALAVAQDGDQIWVAAGTYRPDFDPATGEHTGDRTATFQLKSGITLYGGFAGTETTLQDRAALFDQTILTGDLTGDDGPLLDPADPSATPDIEALLDEPTRGDNAYHVVTGDGTDTTAVLDGFTITGGQANGDFPHNGGGGLSSLEGSPTVRNCRFEDNAADFGGGVATFLSTGVLIDCAFSGNAAGLGGGLYSLGDHDVGATFGPNIERCRFCGNAAINGGGLYTQTRVLPTVTDCVFTGNSAAQWGGGIAHLDRSGATLTGCLLEQNTAQDGGGWFADAGTIATDCIFRANRAQRGGGLRGGPHRLISCTFLDNVAEVEGGAMRVGGGTFRGCLFRRNRALLGGGIYSAGGAPHIFDSAFQGSGSGDGAAIWNIGGFGGDLLYAINCTFVGGVSGVLSTNGSRTTLTNCTFTRNGLALRTTDSSNIVVTNCIVWNDRVSQEFAENIAVTYSNVEGGWPGEGNIDQDPLFVRRPHSGGDVWGDDPRTRDVDEGANDDYGDLRLRPGSPAIDAGAGDALHRDAADQDQDGDSLEPIPFDAFGNPRRLDDPETPDTGRGDAPMVDMGAYEFVLPGDQDFDFDVDLADYLKLLSCLQGPAAPAAASGCGTADLDRDGDVDLADLVAFQAAFTGAR